MVVWMTSAAISLAMLALGIGIPLAAFDDCDCGLTPIQQDRLEARARDRIEAPALRLQITSATTRSADPYAGQGVVVVRGPFGIQTGEVRLADQEDIQRSARRELGAWALLAAAVGLPFAVAGRCWFAAGHVSSS